MKKIIIIMLTVLSTSAFTQETVVAKTNLIMSGRVDFGRDIETRVVVTNQTDTIVDKMVKKRYKMRLPQNQVYDVSFTNSSSTKLIIVSTLIDEHAHVLLDINWLLSNNDVVALVMYNIISDNYEFSTFLAGKE